ncbi:hypothetical protein EVAR_73621_1 [Eumeta japonica]|uniref:Uncharacterized protein n=1 Tax=Eumeta variegata TaxID=151549 RepID=A0A4C1T9E2_EUMVA|nr:hypothetical protein EVAR_73621_1 [Eumeta japonica]
MRTVFVLTGISRAPNVKYGITPIIAKSMLFYKSINVKHETHSTQQATDCIVLVIVISSFFQLQSRYAMPLPIPMNGNGPRIVFLNLAGDIAKGLVNLDDLYKVVFIHSDDFTNEETGIPLKYLPTYLGGQNGSAEEHVKEFEKKFLEYESYFKENANYGTNELLRPVKPIDFDGIYGLGGSFRKLDVD